MSTSTTQFYSPNVVDFETKTVAKSEWEAELKQLEDSTCTHWNNKGFKVKESEATNTIGRIRTILWSKKYTCHRGPNCYVSKAREGERPVQKETKRIGCPAYILVVCYAANPDVVVFERKNQHNHVPGSYADLKFMIISPTLREEIKNFLCRGFSRRDIRSCLLQEMDGEYDSRDKFFHYDDVYNIWVSVATQMFKFKDDEFASLAEWKNKLEEDGYRCIYNRLDNVFYYGFLSAWQMDILRVSKCFSLDSTFGISSRSNEVLYTLIVRHPDTGKGVPVAYLITNDQSVSPVLTWLQFLRDNCFMKPDQITVDCSIPESDAIRVTFGDNCKIQLCLFHVAQCWSRNIVKKVKNSPGQHENVKLLRGNIMSELQSIMYESVRERVVEKVDIFREKWSSLQPQFIEYLEDKWFALEGYKKWAAAYVIEEHAHMQTNNYIESWHNQLKSVYLKRIRNRRLDRLVYILSNDVESDMKTEVRRIDSEAGRMGPELRLRRKREIAAGSIPNDRLNEMINQVDENQYNVESFTQEDIMYSVLIGSESGRISSCSCSYFKFNHRVCKHMFLLKRKINIPVLAVSRMETLLRVNNLVGDVGDVADVETSNTLNDSRSDISVLKRNIKLELDSFRHLKRNINSINDRDLLENVFKKLKEIREEVDRGDRTRVMGTQRNNN